VGTHRQRERIERAHCAHAVGRRSSPSTACRGQVWSPISS